MSIIGHAIKLSALIGVTFAAGCASIATKIEPPGLSVVGLQLLDAGLTQQRYGITFKIDNPNPVPLPVKSINYVLTLAGREFASGATPQSFSIAANGESQFEIEVQTNLLESITQLAEWVGGGKREFDYELAGEIQVGIPLVAPIPVSHAGTIPIVRN